MPERFDFVPPDAERNPGDPTIAIDGTQVVEVATGRVIWEPDDASALCWVANGREILIARQEEIARHEWPTRKFLARSQDPDMATPSKMRASHDGRFAAVAWQGEDIAGLGVVDVATLQFLRSAEYDLGWAIEGPVFSDDDHWLVSCDAAEEEWWLSDPPRECGKLIVAEVGQWRYVEIPLFSTPPANWSPSNEWEKNLVVSAPVFTNNHTVRVTLPTGEERTIDLDSAGSEGWESRRSRERREQRARDAAQLESMQVIINYNLNMAELHARVEGRKIACPYCRKSAIPSYAPGSSLDRAILRCGACGSSFRPEDLRAAGPGAQPL